MRVEGGICCFCSSHPLKINGCWVECAVLLIIDKVRKIRFNLSIYWSFKIALCLSFVLVCMEYVSMVNWFCFVYFSIEGRKLFKYRGS